MAASRPAPGRRFVPRWVVGRRALAALGDPTLRIYFTGQAISVTGTWMNLVAIGWTALAISGSPFVVGAATAARTIPFLVLSLPAGVAADRFDRRVLIIATSVLAMATSVLLGVLTISGRLDTTSLLVLAAVLGVGQALEVPALLSFVSQAAGPGRIANAVAMNVLVWNSARVVGPGLAGILIATLGAGVVFLVNALSYVPVIIGMLVIRRRDPGTAARTEDRSIGRAVSFLRTEPRLRALLTLLACNTLTVSGALVLAPAVAHRMGAGPEVLGVLLSAAGAGAVAAALLLAVTSEDRRRLLLLGAGAVTGLAHLGIAAVPGMAPAVMLYGLVGGGMVAFTATANAAIQVLTPDGLRGRMMSFYAIVIPGIMPLGSLLVGTLAEAAGVPGALAVGGLAWLVILAATFGWSRAIRRL